MDGVGAEVSQKIRVSVMASVTNIYVQQRLTTNYDFLYK
jgi:hypothetical protein